MLFLAANPGDWSVEQVPGALRYILDLPVWKSNVQIQHFTGMSSRRLRTIVSKTDLDLEKLNVEEMRRVFVSPQEILTKAYGLNPDRPLILKSCMGYFRSALQPAFTVTSNAQSFGYDEKNMRRMSGTVMLKLIGVEADDWEWPEKTSETTKLKHGAQVVPPSFAALVQLAKHNSRLRCASGRSQLENFWD